MTAAVDNKGRRRRRYDGRIITEQPTTAGQIIGSLSRYSDPANPANAYDAKERLEHDRARELGHKEGDAVKTWEQARSEITSISEEEKNTSRQLAQSAKGYKLPPEPIRVSVREAIASARMEGFVFTVEELADLEKIAAGEITVAESIQIEYNRLEKFYYDHPEKFYQMPDFLRKKLKKQRKLAEIEQKGAKK